MIKYLFKVSWITIATYENRSELSKMIPGKHQMTLLLYLPRHLWVNSAASPTNKVNPLVIFLSYGNQSIDQQNKSTEWFLYDGNIDR